jgi:hypothetical protein
MLPPPPPPSGMSYTIGLDDKSIPLKKECISIHVKSKSAFMFIFHRGTIPKSWKIYKKLLKGSWNYPLTSKKER